MDISAFPQSNPLIVLLNEIEILRAQIRLLELHVKRVQSLTGDGMARLHADYQRELTALRSTLIANEESLAAQEIAASTQTKLQQELQLLEAQLAAQRRDLAERDAEILRARADVAGMQERIGELASACAQAQADAEGAALARGNSETAFAAIRAAYEEAQSRLQTAETVAAEQQRGLQSQCAELDDRLRDANTRAEDAAAARDGAERENIALRSRLAELEVAGAKEVKQARLQFEAQLAELRDAVEARDQALHEHRSAAHANERRLRGNLLDAQKELGEKGALVASVEERLRAALERSRAFEQRVAQLEVANHQLTAQARSLEDGRRSQAEDIETLRHQTSVQERALIGRQEAVTAVELALHDKIQTLQRDLASSRREIDERDQNLERAQAASEALRHAHEAEVAALRAAVNGLESQKGHLETAQQALEENHRRVDQDSRELAARLSLQDQGDQRSQAKITELQLQLAERQLLAERRAAEIADLKTAVSGLAEEITKLEATAAARQNRITELEEERRIERQSLENKLAVQQENAAGLSRRIAELEKRDQETDIRLKSHAQEAATATADAAAWHARVQQLESLMREKEQALAGRAEVDRKRLETELAAVYDELRDKAWSRARQQAALENLALAHKTQLQKLELRIDEQQRAIESRDGELAQARSHARSLEQQIGRWQDERRDGAPKAVHETDPASEEHTAMNNDELDQQATKRREDSSEQPSPGAGEQSLRDEITRLQREAQEKNQILQDRNDELVRVKAQLDHLSDRMAQLESSSTRDENSFHDEADQMRNEFQAQLALLQAELSQREWALEERQAKAHSVEQDLRQELDTVRRRLAAKNAADQAARDFVFDAPDANHAPEETFELNGGNQSTAPGSFASHRRWNRGLNWKRRWRS